MCINGAKLNLLVIGQTQSETNTALWWEKNGFSK